MKYDVQTVRSSYFSSSHVSAYFHIFLPTSTSALSSSSSSPSRNSRNGNRILSIIELLRNYWFTKNIDLVILNWQKHIFIIFIIIDIKKNYHTKQLSTLMIEMLNNFIMSNISLDKLSVQWRPKNGQLNVLLNLPIGL